MAQPTGAASTPSRRFRAPSLPAMRLALLWLHFLGLILALGLIAYCAYLVRASAADDIGINLPAGSVQVSDGAEPWLLVALAGAFGVALSLLFGVGYHGFVKRTFRPALIPFHWVKVLHGAVVTTLFFGLADLAIPAGILPGGGLDTTATVLAVAVLLGYFSDDAFDKLHKLVSRLLGQAPAARVGATFADLAGADFPIDMVAEAVKRTGTALDNAAKQGVDHAVEALTRHGYRSTKELLSRAGDPDGAAVVARQVECSQDAILRLARSADIARYTGDLEEAAATANEDPEVWGGVLLRQAKLIKGEPTKTVPPSMLARAQETAIRERARGRII